MAKRTHKKGAKRAKRGLRSKTRANAGHLAKMRGLGLKASKRGGHRKAHRAKRRRAHR